MRVAGRGYSDGVRNGSGAGVSEWWKQAGDIRRGKSYGAKNIFKCSRRSRREANWARLSATS